MASLVRQSFATMVRLILATWDRVALGSTLVFSLMHVPWARAANMDWQMYESGVSIYLHGPIIPGDEEHFRQLVLAQLRAGHHVDSVYIYSPGGSVPAAVHIGRQIRTLRASTSGPNRLLEL